MDKEKIDNKEEADSEILMPEKLLADRCAKKKQQNDEGK